MFYTEYLGSPHPSNMEMRLALSASSVAQMELSKMAYPLLAFAKSYVDLIILPLRAFRRQPSEPGMREIQ